MTLVGRHLRLEPLTRAHAEGLREAGADAEVWRWMPEALTSGEAIDRWIKAALLAQAAGSEFPFAVVERPGGRVLGSTRYMDVASAHRGVEIGWTWYRPDSWGGPVNPEAKLLLLRHAFEDWGAIRVYLKTDSLNARSRAAIEKLGARHEGDLRNHRIRADGSYRHSSYYSILDSEWPEVKRGLVARLAAFDRR